MERFELPEGWEWKKLSEVARTTSGGTPSRKISAYFSGDIPWVKSGELEDGWIFDTEEKISREGLENSNAKIFAKGTLLIAMYGATVGKLGILGIDAATNQAVCAIFPDESLNRDFLFAYLRTVRTQLLHDSFGAAQPNISQTLIKEMEIPIPPLSEQRRIVARIEELTKRVEEAKKVAREALIELDTFTPALLAKAFRGEL